LRHDDARDGIHPARPPLTDLARSRTYTTPQQLAQRAQAVPKAGDSVVQAVHPEPSSDVAAGKSEPHEPMRMQPVPDATEMPKAPQPSPLTAGAGPANADLSIQVHESQISHTTSTLNPTSLPRSVDPVPLPQPRYNSPK
jgi:hypothetical protein